MELPESQRKWKSGHTLSTEVVALTYPRPSNHDWSPSLRSLSETSYHCSPAGGCATQPVHVPRHTILDAWLKLLAEAIVHGIFAPHHARTQDPMWSLAAISGAFSRWRRLWFLRRLDVALPMCRLCSWCRLCCWMPRTTGYSTTLSLGTLLTTDGRACYANALILQIFVSFLDGRLP